MQKSMELNGSVYDDTGTFIYAGVLLFTAILYFPLSQSTVMYNQNNNTMEPTFRSRAIIKVCLNFQKVSCLWPRDSVLLPSVRIYN